MTQALRRTSRQSSLLITQFLGDSLFCFIGLSAALWLRFFTSLRNYGFAAESADRFFADYVPLLTLGTVLLLGTFFYLNLYDVRLLLRPHRSFALVLKGLFFWFCVFLGTSLALKFEPAVSRMFVLFSTGTTLLSLMLWRYGFYTYMSRSRHREGITQRVAILGWTKDAAKLSDAIARDHNHPYEVVGLIESSAPVAPGITTPPLLGQIDRLEEVLKSRTVDILVVADLDMPREQLERVATLCERVYVAFKIIPSFFQIFVSNLHLQTISGVSILGVESLPLDSLPNRIVKRSTDIFGALVGLGLSLPIMIALALLIRKESPGPVIYRQTRVGQNGRPFTIYKLRSMHINAESDSGPQWAVKGDPRRLKIGAFMRENNLDELPQFWNVLTGDMSLVGPRPERPELIADFERTIPHYNPRHTVRPGLSGWAQVNGLRGDTSLIERVKYDLYYIENWSVWFDIQIMLLTFVRLKNAY